MRKLVFAFVGCTILGLGFVIWDHYHRESERIMFESAKHWTDRFAELALYPFFEEHARLPASQEELESFLEVSAPSEMYTIKPDGESDLRCLVCYELQPSLVLEVVYEAHSNGMRRISSKVRDTR